MQMKMEVHVLCKWNFKITFHTFNKNLRIYRPSSFMSYWVLTKLIVTTNNRTKSPIYSVNAGEFEQKQPYRAFRNTRNKEKLIQFFSKFIIFPLYLFYLIPYVCNRWCVKCIRNYFTSSKSL